MLSNLTTSARIWLLAICAMAGIGLVGSMGLYEIVEMGEEIRDGLADARAETSAMLEVKTTQSMFLLQVKAFKDVLLRGNNEESYEKHLKEFKDRQADVATHLAAAIQRMKEAGIASGDAEALALTHAELSAKYLDALNGFAKGDPEGGKNADKLVRGIDRPTTEKLNKLVLDMERHFATKTAEQSAHAESESRRAKWLFSSTLLIGFAVVGYMAVLIHRQLMDQLGGDSAYTAKIVAAIAEGNLSDPITVRPGDTTSLLASMKNMQSVLRRVIGDIRQAAEAVGSASTHLATTASQVAKGSDQQSESSASMAASIEQLTASIEQVSTNAQDTRQLSSETRGRSKEGSHLVERTIEDVNAAAKSMQETMAAVYQLGDQSASISGIVGVIREIADQTNLLALNAAIESARAGEQGRGFAVVADEVRKLAEKTSTSTEEIARMIVTVQEGVQAAIRQMESGMERVNAGIEAASNTGVSVQYIEDGANKVLEAVAVISEALREQSSAAATISHNVEATAHLAEENGAAVHELSSSISRLDLLAQTLRQSVSRFQI